MFLRTWAGPDRSPLSTAEIPRRLISCADKWSSYRHFCLYSAIISEWTKQGGQMTQCRAVQNLGGEEARRTSNQSAAIHPEPAVHRGDGVFSIQALRNQHSVKRIPVMEGQLLQNGRILTGILQSFESTPLDHLQRIETKIQLADRGLDHEL